MSSEAVRIARELDPDLVIDGEMAADTALVPEIARENFPMSAIQGDANVLVFPDLQAGNIAYKLVQHLAGAAQSQVFLGNAKAVLRLADHREPGPRGLGQRAAIEQQTERVRRAASDPAAKLIEL